MWHWRCMVLAAVVACVGGGCSKDSGQEPIGLAPRQSREMEAARGGSGFEGEKDPPFNAQTHFAAGQLAESQNAPARALEQYQASLKIDPHHLPSLYRLGVIYAQQKSWPQAIAAWQAYVKETGNEPGALANLGFCCELAGQPEKAEKAYKQGIAIDRRSQPCRINYGLMLARSGRTTEALAQLQAVLSEAQAHYDIASALEQQGNRAEARVEYQKALSIDPELGDAKARLAGMD
jgi:tetratricopeptide (TPR) repeat protein